MKIFEVCKMREDECIITLGVLKMNPLNKLTIEEPKAGIGKRKKLEKKEIRYCCDVRTQLTREIHVCSRAADT